MTNPRPQCELFLDRAVKAIAASPELVTVVLIARWQYSATGTRPEVGGSLIEYLTDAQSRQRTQAENVEVMRRGLGRMVERLRALGRNVIVVGGVPETGFDVPTVLALASLHRTKAPADLAFDGFWARYGASDSVFNSLAKDAGIRYVPLWKVFCTPDCKITSDGVPIYNDDDHITATAARSIVAPYLKRVLGGPSLQ